MPESWGHEAAHTLCLREAQTAMLGSVYPGRRGRLDLRAISPRDLREAGVRSCHLSFAVGGSGFDSRKRKCTFCLGEVWSTFCSVKFLLVHHRLNKAVRNL